MAVNRMSDVIARLVESEIELAFALIGAGLLDLKLGKPTALSEARERAEAAYLRARADARELPDRSKQVFMDRLFALRSALDKLPQSASAAVAGDELPGAVGSKCSFAMLRH